MEIFLFCKSVGPHHWFKLIQTLSPSTPSANTTLSYCHINYTHVDTDTLCYKVINKGKCKVTKK